MSTFPYRVAVVGAGPAGIFAARELAQAGVQVALLNRDIKPGGLAEYGIYFDKHKMKEGLRKQFRQILALPNIAYYGNVMVGRDREITLDELRAFGFQAVLVTAGAQGTKWLGLPGEDLHGVYHAKDLVYHYNHLPPFSRRQYHIGKRVAVVGVGNVMMDMAHWLIRDNPVEAVIAVGRRGPAEVKFDKSEMETVAANLDLPELDAELERCRPIMEAIGQNVAQARANIIAGLLKAKPRLSETHLYFDFLASPTRLLGDAQDHVVGLEVEDNTLVLAGADTKAKGLGTRRVIHADTVIFAIGDQVDAEFGLPVKNYAFIKAPNPRFPVEGHSYEAFDPATNAPIEGVFFAGWSREASTGVVGAARKDGTNGAKAVLEYLRGVPAPTTDDSAFRAKLGTLRRPYITQAHWQQLEAAEQAEAKKLGVEFFKFDDNIAMLQAIGLA